MYLMGKRLRQLRINAQITQVKLAKNIGVATSTLSLYESGRREPSIRTIQRIAEELHCTSDYLLGLRDEPSFFITEMEKALVRSFRQKKEMQKPVCLLLGIEPSDYYPQN